MPKAKKVRRLRNGKWVNETCYKTKCTEHKHDASPESKRHDKTSVIKSN